MNIPGDDNHYHIEYDQPCRYGHTECSDSWNGACMTPDTETVDALYVEALRLIAEHDPATQNDRWIEAARLIVEAAKHKETL